MMNNPADTISRPAWNQADLLERIDHDEELLQELLSIFRADFPKTLRALEAAIASADLKASATLSHTLKGMLSNMGGMQASAAASQLEKLASAAGRPDSLRSALNVLQTEAGRLNAELDAYAAGALE
ncbi:MAG TPA: Hpt domain-containing protein [Candidatus Acidoferrum sp.]|nr:Hpt domain-containing protein [Candidatus Acidoferrum sp.]